MTAPGVFTQYSTVVPFIGTKPGWVDTADQERIASYQIYEEMYWSSESGFQTVMRGDNDSPIMMPTGRTLVNTVNRYTAPDFGFRVDGEDATAKAVAQMAFDKLFERETFFGKFKSNKLMGSVRGDWLGHVVGDMDKPLGKRLSIYAVDPASYFPIPHPDDPNRIIGCHLAEQTTLNGQPAVNRLTYRKVLDEETGETVAITREHGIFEPDKWWLATTPKVSILPLEELDQLIKFLPVWHIKNFDTNAPFGSSTLRGLEALLLGVNQTMSDEDLTLALEGIGVYATDGDAPVDENNNEVDWILGPGRVLTKANNLRRISGATNLSAYGDHYDRLRHAAHESLGASDVAVGSASAGDAESGIALAIRLGPILAYTGDADTIIMDVHRQFFYGLQFLFQVYEELPMITTDEAGNDVPIVQVVPTIGTKVPTNVTEVVNQIVALRNTVPPVISLRTSHDLLRAAGMTLPDDELQVLAAEATAQLDPLAEPGAEEEVVEEERVAEELA